jgi:HlyD family secretion protein
LLVVVGVLVVAIMAIATWGKRDTQPKYITGRARRGDLVITVSATGTLEPLKKVDVGSEVSGTIKTSEADYNDKVKVGQVLARIDTSRLEAQASQNKAALEAAKARVLQAQASLQEAEAQLARLKRLRELSEGKMPSQNDLDSAEANVARCKADLASAQASVAQAEAALNVILTDISKSVIRSPIDGIVLDRAIEPGQTVAASFQAPRLFTLAEDLTQMELRVDIDEADVGLVHEDQDATFTVDAYPDRTFPAKVTQVRFGPQTVSGVVTYKGILRVDNSDLLLRPGMTATAVITVDRRTDALLVPNAALRFAPINRQTNQRRPSGGLVGRMLPRPPRFAQQADEPMDLKGRHQQVWTVRDGQLVAIPVEVGATDGNWTEILSGDVQPDMELVIDQVVQAR